MANKAPEILPGMPATLPFAMTICPSGILKVAINPLALVQEAIVDLLNHPQRPRNCDLVLFATVEGQARDVHQEIERRLQGAGNLDPYEHWRKQGFDV